MNKQVEQIKAEIERLKESGCASPIVICDTLLAFIDSMQEEPVCDDLEQAAIDAFKKITADGKNSFLEIFKAGVQWHKQQIIKDAKKGLVCGHTEDCPAWIELSIIDKPNINVGDKVKIYIIKED